MNIPGFVRRAEFEKVFRELLDKEMQIDAFKEITQQQRSTISVLTRGIKAQASEIATLNASLDATAAELDKIRNALAVSEQHRKQLLKAKRRG